MRRRTILLGGAASAVLAAAVFDATAEEAMKFAHRAADRLGLELLRTVGGSNWSSAIDAAVKAGAQALSMLFPFFAFGMRFTAEEVIRLTAERRIPAIYVDSETVELGGLMSYGTNLSDDMRRGADLLARVLRGEKPGDLSVDQAARFELAINLGAARAIGLKIPQSLLVRADRVIE